MMLSKSYPTLSLCLRRAFLSTKSAEPLQKIQDELFKDTELEEVVVKRTAVLDKKIDTLEDLLVDKIEAINKNLADLKETQEKLRAMQMGPDKYTIHWTDPDEVERLFDVSEQQKREMEEHLQHMKDFAEENAKFYAVDAPDGESDGQFIEEEDHINRIIDQGANMAHSLDLSDAQMKDMKAHLQKAKALAKENAKYFAVDAPDGEGDWHVIMEEREIEHIIDEQARLEDTTKVKKAIRYEKAIQKEHARDPEHDW